MPRVVELAGGVGGAKLADGLQAVLGPDLTVIVNTGDDFVRHGLAIWPDHDTVAYTLAGLDDAERGWGLADETWHVMDGLARLGEDSWFRLGDRDLATHVWRTDRLREGWRPTEVARELQARIGVTATVLPMTDAEVRTEFRTDEGWLEFQEYFVHRHQAPEVREVAFPWCRDRSANGRGGRRDRSRRPGRHRPIHPIVSIGPILAVPGLTDLLAQARRAGTPIVAVSGIVGGRALKGPADRMLTSLGHAATAAGVAALLVPHLDGFVLDTIDADLEREIADLGLRTFTTDTIMGDDDARARVARETIAFAESLRRPASVPSAS